MENKDLLNAMRVQFILKGISQTAIADYLGVTNQSVCKWFKGTRVPTYTHLVKMLDMLGMDAVLVNREM